MISFIIPLYNIPNKYLNRCLNSFYSQKRIKECEIIVVNDASPIKENHTLCMKFKSLHKNFKYIKLEKNIGVSTARFIGLTHSNKEFCCFFDSDDFINENSLEILIETIKNERMKFDIWKSIERFVDGETLNINWKSSSLIKEFKSSDKKYSIKFYKNCMIGGKILKTNIAKDVSMFAQRIQNHEDLFFILCYLLKIKWERIGKIDYEIFSICTRSNSASNNPNIYQKCLSFLWFLDMFYLYRLDFDNYAYFLKRKVDRRISFEFSSIVNVFFNDLVRLYEIHYSKEKSKVNNFYKNVLHKLRKDFGVKKISKEWTKKIRNIKSKCRPIFLRPIFLKKIIKFILKKMGINF